MPAPYSTELRALALEHFRAGKSALDIFRTVLRGKVSIRTLYRWNADYIASGKESPVILKLGRPTTICTNVHKERVKKLLKENNSMRAISRKLEISLSSVKRMVAKLKLKV